MPYDGQGRWYPPSEANGWQDDWETSSYDLREAIEDGSFSEIGSLDALKNLYDTSEWKGLNDLERVDVVRRYQDMYHDYFTESFKQSDEWGLDLRREDMSYDTSDDWNSITWFSEHVTGNDDYSSGDATIDYGSYNDDELYQAAKQFMVKDHPELFGTDVNSRYDSPAELRAAKKMIDGWTPEQTEEYKQWAKENITTYNEADELLYKYQPTRNFNPDTMTTTTHHHLREKGSQAINTRQWLPPAPPTSLKIREGNAPVPEYNSDGTRKPTSGDLNQWYNQYLGKDADQGGIDYWLDQQQQNQWSYSELERQIMLHPDAKSADPSTKGRVFYNPQAYGTEESIKAKMADDPPKIQAPSITIRNIGEPKKPTRHYMALNDTVWTDPSVDTRSTGRWRDGSRPSTGKPRKNAEFLTKAPVKGGT